MLTAERLAEIVKAADQPVPDNSDYERMRGMVAELVDELAVRDEMLCRQYRRISDNEDNRSVAEDARFSRRYIEREIGILHRQRSR